MFGQRLTDFCQLGRRQWLAEVHTTNFRPQGRGQPLEVESLVLGQFAGETPAMACVRETREETGLSIWLAEQLCTLEHKGRIEHVFLASKFRGTLRLGGPELARMTPDNQYHLRWLDYAQLQQVKLRPKNLLVYCREWLWPVEE
ncbi:NUDIX hydrolase [Aquitalea magnusonii]|uniref:NUDIX hydrolase n=1 Tax=Aquitalea magnusonii TaxID=332411 RepID=UPI0023BAE87D|nr:NUDIX domain-containing protein [Aquitalea magnusonii]